MSFGISGSPTSNRMVGGDVVVAGVDQSTISGFAQDYYLLDKSQCIVQQDTGQVSGSCPDSNIQVSRLETSPPQIPGDFVYCSNSYIV